MYTLTRDSHCAYMNVHIDIIQSLYSCKLHLEDEVCISVTQICMYTSGLGSSTVLVLGTCT